MQEPGAWNFAVQCPFTQQVVARHKTTIGKRPAVPAWAFVVLSLVTSPGCGDGRPDRYPVSGQVLIDGVPLTYGYVKFVPQGSRPAGGYVDEQGRFTLGCYEKNDGAIPGTHQVEIDAAESISSTERKWHAPKKYSSYATSGITQEVLEPIDSLVINLTWDGKKPFTERTR